MSADQPNEMDENDRDAFLGSGGTGVLSLSTPSDESPYAVPVSYGYDRETGTFYFRLAVNTGSEKGELDDRQATFVTYDQPEDRWQSVVAEGKLEPTSKESIALETLEGLGNVELQYVDIFDQPVESVPFEFYRLVPDRIGARRELRTSR